MSQRALDDLLKDVKALLPITAVTEALFTLLTGNCGHWTHLELKGANEMDDSLIPSWIRDHLGDHRAPSALFITGSADSAVFFHELKEYGDDFYIVEPYASGAKELTLILFYV